MFLFTTPQSQSRETQPASPVVSAIRQGAERTGAGFDYLLKTAQRESSLEPTAKASTSSATGLFQFIEQTWLSMVKQEGPKQGLSQYADAITESGGRLSVSDPAAREKILQLRNDPQVAAVMAGALTQKNRDQLAGSLGRQPQAGELYMAHVLGARGAADLIRAAASDPSRVAARDFPDAAAANRGIFYDKAGRARSVQEVYGVLAASHASTQVAASVAPSVQAGQGVFRSPRSRRRCGPSAPRDSLACSRPAALVIRSRRRWLISGQRHRGAARARPRSKAANAISRGPGRAKPRCRMPIRLRVQLLSAPQSRRSVRRCRHRGRATCPCLMSRPRSRQPSAVLGPSTCLPS